MHLLEACYIFIQITVCIQIIRFKEDNLFRSLNVLSNITINNKCPSYLPNYI